MPINRLKISKTSFAICFRTVSISLGLKETAFIPRDPLAGKINGDRNYWRNKENSRQANHRPQAEPAPFLRPWHSRRGRTQIGWQADCGGRGRWLRAINS